METWKDIPGYKCQVSNLGRVKSLVRTKERILSQSLIGGHKLGGEYCRVSLWNGALQKDFLVHRLVAEAFIPNPEQKPQVNHIDGNKLNNSVENLEWNTISENQIHSVNILKNMTGEKNGRSKIKSEELRKSICERVEKGETRASIARELGVGKSCISRLVKGQTY